MSMPAEEVDDLVVSWERWVEFGGVVVVDGGCCGPAVAMPNNANTASEKKKIVYNMWINKKGGCKRETCFRRRDFNWQILVKVEERLKSQRKHTKHKTGLHLICENQIDNLSCAFDDQNSKQQVIRSRVVATPGAAGRGRPVMTVAVQH